MRSLTLIIANKNYSSWSLRAWLLLKQLRIPFDEVLIPLDTVETRGQILRYSASGRVPVLLDGEQTIWDSLAIAEYLAERFPDAQLWPAEPEARARARCVSAEMHSGFVNLRTHLPMNCRADFPDHEIVPEVQAEIDRIVAIWQDCRSRYGAHGDLLFGAFSIADAMFAPVAFRFATYGVALEATAAAYVQTLLALPTVQEWLEAARAEPYKIAEYEN